MTDAPSSAPAPPASLPGDVPADERLRQIVRVDHAGEYGACRIYRGQLAMLDPRSPVAGKIRHMAEQERQHLEEFDRQIAERRIRPTALLPLWHAVGFALGAATALMGEKAAMACTIAVEEVIDDHYARQRQQLQPEEAMLSAKIERFRQEEVEHRDTAKASGGMEVPGYRLLSGAIKSGSRLAIWLSERL